MLHCLGNIFRFGAEGHKEFKIMRIPLFSVLSVLALAGMTAQAAQGTPPTSTPTLDYIQTENELILNYTGTLLQSSDAVN